MLLRQKIHSSLVKAISPWYTARMGLGSPVMSGSSSTFVVDVDVTLEHSIAMFA